MLHYILGNGPSLTRERLLSLGDGPTWGVNRIWKLWEEDPNFHWRPDFYVRCEMPTYSEEMVKEDLSHIVGDGIRCFFQKGFRGFVDAGPIRKFFRMGTSYTYFETCDGTEEHDWHLPKICGYGTVVHIAAQLAILKGATEIAFVGCDLGTPAHFYGDEGNAVDAMLWKAHKIAARCSPVPIYDTGYALTMYPCLET